MAGEHTRTELGLPSSVSIVIVTSYILTDTEKWLIREALKRALEEIGINYLELSYD